MNETILYGIAAIPIIGVIAQWIAWRTRIPSIIILLIFGFLAGPVTGLIDPSQLLGKIMFPVVSILVSIIVFEGGLSLKIADLKNIGKVVRNLITIGTLITFSIIAVSSYYVLDLSVPLSIMFGAMMVITGPTVIVPMLRHVKLSRHLGSLIRWEGILIAPVGAILIVLVYPFATAVNFHQALGQIGITLVMIILTGNLIGILGAMLILFMIRKKWAPDFLQESISLIIVIGVYTIANVIQDASGILSVVVMGMLLVNQKKVLVKHIIVFKENLRILAISTLFIILAADLELSDLYSHLNSRFFIFLLILIFVARPLAVFISTLGSNLNWREKAFAAWMAPRGIVTASIASLFALRMVSEGIPEAKELVPLSFMVIICTVTIYGLTAEKFQKILKLSRSDGGAVLLVGANLFSRMLAKALHDIGVFVMLVDTNKDRIIRARLANLVAYHNSIYSEDILEEVQMGGITYMLALTGSDDVNMLSNIQYEEILSRDTVFRLPPEQTSNKTPDGLQNTGGTQALFRKDMTYTQLNTMLQDGKQIEILEITKDLDMDTFKSKYPETVALMGINKDKKLRIVDAGSTPVFKEGDKWLIFR
ncbi:hypothetical protein HOH87_01385 [bacterium]|jgi:NhaP-type Na+/H+ or K+/H+ antiporter|nr:hypothetical protein [bacterium]